LDILSAQTGPDSKEIALSLMTSVAAALLCVLTLGGCASKSYTALDLTVGPPPETPSENSAAAITYKVDIIGVSDDIDKQLQGLNPSEWFASEGPWAKKRSELRPWIRTFSVRAGSGTYVFRRNETIWNSWRVGGVDRLRIIADPPPGAEESSAWIRDIEPMSGTWENNALKIWVDASGIRLDRSPLDQK
jgi:hypothetical protein